MRKVKYEELKMEIITFHTADIITTSTGSFDGEWVPITPTDKGEKTDFTW